MKSISVQYQELKEGKMNKHQFLRNARMMFPNFVTNHNSFEDSVKILKTKGLLNEGNAVQGTPDKAPTYKYPNEATKYKKVEQSPEVDEQDGIYPATTLTDIPTEKMDKKVKDKSDGLEPIKPKDTKNEMKKIRIVKESKKNLTETEDKKDQSKLSSSPGTSVPMSTQTQSKIGDFLSQFRSPDASGPGQSLNKLKSKIKEIVREMVNEYERGDESDEAPSVLGVIDIIIKKMINDIESNDLNLEFRVKDVEDELNYFQDKIGHRYSDKQFEDIIDGAVVELKKQGYNLK
jgi:hypothetical protein